MPDQVKGLLVVLEDGIDDAEHIIDAIQRIEGVLKVESQVTARQNEGFREVKHMSLKDRD